MMRPPVMGFDCARCALKWFWFVLQVRSVNHVESASEIVRPKGCWYTVPTSKSSKNRPSWAGITVGVVSSLMAASCPFR